ncbi:MAG: response regulator [Acidobacteriota bacterium]|nr:response regulator [Blastocatellia bacterium]MDW8413750.1 response regulator [Acidobacteriota bacterium]
MKKILVVDDEQDLLDLMEIILGAEGYQVVKAVNGKDALEKVDSEKPDLILLDVMMPIMDGWQVLRTLKKNESLKHIPIVMVTAKIGTEDRMRGLQEGAADYICKPFAPRDVVTRLRAILH